MKQYLAISCLLALSSVRADGPLGGLVYAPAHSSAEYYAYPSYAFDYAVKDPTTGDNKAQWEKREGDVVKGAYSLVEPDGSLRIVEYWADDKSGFNAVVKRVGPNLHPVGVPVAGAPVYKAPIPVLPHLGPIGPVSVGPVAKFGGLAAAPILIKPIVPRVYPSAGNLLHTAPIHSAPIIKTAPIIGPIAQISPYGSVYKAPYSLPISGYSDLDYIGVKGPLMNTWDTPIGYDKYIH